MKCRCPADCGGIISKELLGAAAPIPAAKARTNSKYNPDRKCKKKGIVEQLFVYPQYPLGFAQLLRFF